MKIVDDKVWLILQQLTPELDEMEIQSDTQGNFRAGLVIPIKSAEIRESEMNRLSELLAAILKERYKYLAKEINFEIKLYNTSYWTVTFRDVYIIISGKL